ncbi:hypothetical protein E0Z10_g5422 [Xylaria hypoxylon]|uniref:Uncharacterized protein n=1 Tax=Xylaria hypoxylon TaxID=37992 RepID=A0A4Z0YIP8_9PEZI|nr:hypothetical protein E0Z10_g5422 [Xylaria hypoxylon]
MKDHGIDNGDSNNLREPQHAKSQELTDSLYDGPLDHIIRNHPELFVRPQFWTRCQAKFLHVVYKEEQPKMIFSHQHLRLTHKYGEHEDRVQDADMSTPKSNKGEYMLRVPLFEFPDVKSSYMHSHIDKPKTNTDSLMSLRMTVMERLMLERKRKRKRKSSKNVATLGIPDQIANQPVENRNHEINNNTKDIHHRLKVKNIPLAIEYGRRRIIIVPNCRNYILTQDTPSAPQHAWRLIYLDQSQVKNRWSSKRKRRNQIMADKLGIQEDVSDTSLSEGFIASLFIAMAQQRQYEIEEEKQRAQQSAANMQEPSQARPNSVELQLQPRYQILLSDKDGPDMHLYTAHVSDFLLEHFRTPARLPQVAQPKYGSPLLKIHRTVIPFLPCKSFRRRLRRNIMYLANSTVDGFFPGVNPQHNPEKEGARQRELGVILEPSESTDRKHQQQQLATRVRPKVESATIDSPGALAPFDDSTNGKGQE